VSSRAVWLLLALALALRLGYVAATPNYVPIHDDHDYDRLACAIVDGAGYPNTGPVVTPTSCGRPRRDTHPTAFRPPAWPATLAAVYAVSEPFTSDRWLAARIALALLGTLAAGLTGLVATRLWGRRAGLWALGLAATCVPLIMIGGSLITETLFTVLELAAVAAVLVAGTSRHRVRWALAAGVLLGLIALIRSNGVLLAIPLALGVWGPSPRLSWRAVAPVSALLAAAAVVIAPWTIRNAFAMDAFVPVGTEAGSALIGTYNVETQEHAAHYRRSWKSPRRLGPLQPLLRKPLAEPARERQLIDAALDYIRDHPTAPLATIAINTGRLFWLDGPGWWHHSARTIDAPRTAADASAAWLALAAPFVLVGVVSAWRRRTPLWLWLVPLLMLLSATLVVGEWRFRAPLDPFLVLLAALGADAVVTWLRRPAGASRRSPSRASGSDRELPTPSGS
jgi:Dolichyl-phosphate-mannose-protein mannosyltransferase